MNNINYNQIPSPPQDCKFNFVWDIHKIVTHRNFSTKFLKYCKENQNPLYYLLFANVSPLPIQEDNYTHLFVNISGEFFTCQELLDQRAKENSQSLPNSIEKESSSQHLERKEKIPEMQMNEQGKIKASELSSKSEISSSSSSSSGGPNINFEGKMEEAFELFDELTLQLEDSESFEASENDGPKGKEGNQKEEKREAEEVERVQREKENNAALTIQWEMKKWMGRRSSTQVKSSLKTNIECINNFIQPFQEEVYEKAQNKYLKWIADLDEKDKEGQEERRNSMKDWRSERLEKYKKMKSKLTKHAKTKEDFWKKRQQLESMQASNMQVGEALNEEKEEILEVVSEIEKMIARLSFVEDNIPALLNDANLSRDIEEVKRMLRSLQSE
jgi:hypothetical protein